LFRALFPADPGLVAMAGVDVDHFRARLRAVRDLDRHAERGLQAWPILATLAQYGARNHADVVFADGRARDLEEEFREGRNLMLGRFSSGSPSKQSSPSPRS
jgi:hypothetical protein